MDIAIECVVSIVNIRYSAMLCRLLQHSITFYSNLCKIEVDINYFYRIYGIKFFSTRK